MIDTETPVFWFPPLSINCCATSTPIIHHIVQPGVKLFSVHKTGQHLFTHF